MEPIQIAISFHSAEPNSMPVFAPGQVVSGTVTLMPSGAVECRHIIAKLQWRSEGASDLEIGLIHQIDLFQGRLIAGATTQFPFQFILPQSPWSYSGPHCQYSKVAYLR